MNEGAAAAIVSIVSVHAVGTRCLVGLLLVHFRGHRTLDFVLEELLAVLLCALEHDADVVLLDTERIVHARVVESVAHGRTLSAVTSAAYGPEDLSAGIGTPPSIMPEYAWLTRSSSAPDDDDAADSYSFDDSASLGKLSNACTCSPRKRYVAFMPLIVSVSVSVCVFVSQRRL